MGNIIIKPDDNSLIQPENLTLEFVQSDRGLGYLWLGFSPDGANHVCIGTVSGKQLKKLGRLIVGKAKERP